MVEDHDGADIDRMLDLMVAGGKTSTLTQFTELARRAGLEVIAAGTHASGRFAVECRPAR